MTNPTLEAARADALRIADQLDKLSSSHRPLLDAAAASLRALAPPADESTITDANVAAALRHGFGARIADKVTAAPVTEEGAREVLAEHVNANAGQQIRDGYSLTRIDAGPAIRAMLTFAARASSERERRLVEALEEVKRIALHAQTGKVRQQIVAAARAALGGTDAE